MLDLILLFSLNLGKLNKNYTFFTHINPNNLFSSAQMPSKRLKYTMGRIFSAGGRLFRQFWPESLVKSVQHSSGVPGNTVINYVANLTELKELIGPIRDYPDKLHLNTFFITRT